MNQLRTNIQGGLLFIFTFEYLIRLFTMEPLSTDTALNEVDLTNTRVRKALTDLLPAAARFKCFCSDGVPAEVLKELANGKNSETVGDLVLELAILLTAGDFAEEVEVDTSAVELVPALFDHEGAEESEWARLAFDLSRPDWTVVVSLQALPIAPEPEPESEGVLRILVHAGLDFRGWLSEERTRAMLHEWYVQYQVAGALHSERQLAELHQELNWVEERGRFVFASQLTPLDPAEATWQLQEIRRVGGARIWARQLLGRCDRPAILAANGSWEREEVLSELTRGAERLLFLSAKREC